MHVLETSRPIEFSGMGTILSLIGFFALLSACGKTPPSTPPVSAPAVLSFPENRLVGIVSIEANSTDDARLPQNDRTIGKIFVPGDGATLRSIVHVDARGDITIPECSIVRLRIYGNISSDLSYLESFGAADIHTLIILRKSPLPNYLRTNDKGLRIDDESLASLRSLTSLKRLDLNGAQISNAGMIHLQTLRSLEELDLSNTDVDDGAVETLGTFSSLRRLTLTGSKITPAGLARLRTYLSECEIVDWGNIGIRPRIIRAPTPGPIS